MATKKRPKKEKTLNDSRGPLTLQLRVWRCSLTWKWAITGRGFPRKSTVKLELDAGVYSGARVRKAEAIGRAMMNLKHVASLAMYEATHANLENKEKAIDH